jgi:uncharacterized membrane protein
MVMQTQLFLTLYALSVPIFFIIDIVWLGVIARPFYQTYLADFLGPVNWVAAMIFYFVFLLGLTFFAIFPAVQANQWPVAALYGALFGFFTYATYDLTNYATLKDWPLIVVVVDIVWGVVLGASVAVLTFFAHSWLS